MHHGTTHDPLRALDTLDRYGWRARWVTDLGTPAIVDRSRRMLLLDLGVSRSEAEAMLLGLLGSGHPRSEPLPAPHREQLPD